MKNSIVSRRQFVRTSAAAAGSVALASLVPAAVFGANERIRIGVIGLQDHGSDCWFKNIKLLSKL